MCLIDNSAMRSRWLSLILTVIFLWGDFQYSAVSLEKTIDITKPGNYLLGICASDEQMDCLEKSITVLHADGSMSTAQLIDSQVKAPFVENPNLTIAGFHRFRFSSGSADGYSREFNIRTSLTTSPANALTGLEVRLVSVGKKLRNEECDSPLAKLCTRYNLDPEDVFKIIIRSQAMPIHWLGAHAQNADIVSEKFLNGKKWILSGSQTLIGWNPGLWWSIAAVSSNDSSPLSKRITQCSQHGVVFKSSNEVTGGMPSWNSKTKSLDFGVSGPHLDANGDLFKGFFKARIPKKWLDCAYPENSLAAADEVVVNIVYDDGTIQVATTQTRVTDEMIFIEVPVLHFSSPTIRISNATEVTKASPKPSPKFTNCLKGKIKKKLSGSKCPSGWKIVA